jgi:hypothetical protein
MMKHRFNKNKRNLSAQSDDNPNSVPLNKFRIKANVVAENEPSRWKKPVKYDQVHVQPTSPSSNNVPLMNIATTKSKVDPTIVQRTFPTKNRAGDATKIEKVHAKQTKSSGVDSDQVNLNACEEDEDGVDVMLKKGVLWMKKLILQKIKAGFKISLHVAS